MQSRAPIQLVIPVATSTLHGVLHNFGPRHPSPIRILFQLEGPMCLLHRRQRFLLVILLSSEIEYRQD